MISLGWIQKLDHAKMPNVDENMLAFLQAPAGTRTATTACPGRAG